MGLTAEEAYAAARKFAKDLTQGMTLIEGKNCTIESISTITGGHRVKFKWTADDGTTKTQTMDVMDGADGADGAQGEKGDKGDTGNTGATGADGTAATIQIGSVTSGDTPSVTNSGTSLDAIFNFTLPKGDKGDKGDNGEDGQDGKSFEIKAQYATYEDLIAEHPTGTPGDAYFVGTSSSPDLYTWLSDDETWFNNGPIAGVKGDKGDTGEDGFSPSITFAYITGGTQVTIQNKDSTENFNIYNGSDGADGKSAYEVAVDEGFVGTETEWLESLVGEQGEQGIQGEQGEQGDPGVGIPTAGDEGDILVKNSSDDYDASWKGKDDVLDIVIPQNAGAHNGIYRGKYLGSSVTADQYAEISAGTFKGMYIGDYWTIGGVNYRIASFNYWLHTGDTECTKNHIVLVPDTNLYTAVMNDTNVVTGAYVGSKMYTTNLASAKSTINSAFGSAHVLSHREYLKNTVSGGYETAGAWYDSTVELMTEEMVYGGKEFKNTVQGTNFAAQYTIGKSQLNLFTLDPSKICIRAPWWLRDVASSAYFALVGTNGGCDNNYASLSFGVRPAFAICA